jgi:DNA sulfur modification protein DndB
MAVTLPVIRATMGNREYFISKMSAAELAGQVGIASELADWNELSLNELYQRKLNEKRVEQDIAPYLANTKGRFFGSIIVWVINPDVITFEPVSSVVNVAAAYSSAAKSIGFLVIDASRSGNLSGLVALDGQHRLAALRRVVQGQADGPEAGFVRDDEVAVIFVQDVNVVSARDLFTVLNRSARRVSKSDVLIMSEVDGAAIIARNLTVGDTLAPQGIEKNPLVKWEKNTIGAKDSEVTTLNAIYEVVQVVADRLGIDLQAGEEAGSPPPEADLQSVEVEARHWLELLFRHSSDFAAMQHEPLKVVEMRKEGQFSLMMKPVGFIAFFRAVAVALSDSGCRRNDVAEVVKALLNVDWDIKSNLWKGIMVNAKGNVTNKKSDIQLAGDLAAWIAVGETATADFQESLGERYRRQLGRRDAPLPSPKNGH